jgi:hypothetical protein
MWRSASFAIALTFFSSVASAQQPCTTDARRVVDELYRHMLERGADNGSQFWQTKLQNGEMTVRQLVAEIAKSQEHNQRFIRQENGEETPYFRSVARLYRHILGRQPDTAGARANAQAMAREGAGPVIDAIVNSAEYNQEYGDWGVPGSGGLSYCPPGNRQTSNSVAAPVNPNMNARFRNMDDNNDGTITRGEWKGNLQSFRAHDWNGDGVLAGDELRPGRFRQGQTAEYEDYDRSDRFEYLDGNNNGRVEIYEWHASDAAFHQLDRNGDNYLSRAEMAGEAGAVATSGRNFSDTNLVYVDANQRWTDTGMDVQAGQVIVFDAQGNVQLSDNANDTATPAGARRRAAEAPVRQGPAGGLVARIGNANATFVGARGTVRAQNSGRLFLTVNDDYLDDNRGEYRVNITVRGR